MSDACQHPSRYLVSQGSSGRAAEIILGAKSRPGLVWSPDLPHHHLECQRFLPSTKGVEGTWVTTIGCRAVACETSGPAGQPDRVCSAQVAAFVIPPSNIPASMVLPSAGTISDSTPVADAGTSMVVPSVSISTSGSLRLTGSPTRLNDRPIDAFVADATISGTRISVGQKGRLHHGGSDFRSAEVRR